MTRPSWWSTIRFGEPFEAGVVSEGVPVRAAQGDGAVLAPVSIKTTEPGSEAFGRVLLPAGGSVDGHDDAFVQVSLQFIAVHWGHEGKP